MPGLVAFGVLALLTLAVEYWFITVPIVAVVVLVAIVVAVQTRKERLAAESAAREDEARRVARRRNAILETFRAAANELGTSYAVFGAAARLVVTRRTPTLAALQREFGTTNRVATVLMASLERYGVVAPKIGNRQRVILLTRADLALLDEAVQPMPEPIVSSTVPEVTEASEVELLPMLASAESVAETPTARHEARTVVDVEPRMTEIVPAARVAPPRPDRVMSEPSVSLVAPAAPALLLAPAVLDREVARPSAREKAVAAAVMRADAATARETRMVDRFGPERLASRRRANRVILSIAGPLVLGAWALALPAVFLPVDCVVLAIIAVVVWSRRRDRRLLTSAAVPDAPKHVEVDGGHLVG